MTEPNWQQLLLDLRKHFKCLSYIAPLIGLSVDRTQRIARHGTKTMLWPTGTALINLHNQYCKGKK